MRLVLNSTAPSGHQWKRPSSAASVTAIASGNSLTDPIFDGGASGTNKGTSWLINQYSGSVVSGIAKSTIPGSPMAYRWVNATTPPDAKTLIANYDLLIITDVYSNFDTDTYPPTAAALPSDALLWANHAWANDAEMILWCPNARQDKPDIAAQYARRFELWAAIQDHCNAALPVGKKPVRLIPGAWLWHRFWLDQQAGQCPTPTWYDDLFIDAVHPSGIGSYIICLIHAVCIYGIDPYLLADAIPGIATPTPADVAYIKAHMKNLVKGFDRGGVDVSGWS